MVASRCFSRQAQIKRQERWRMAARWRWSRFAAETSARSRAMAATPAPTNIRCQSGEWSCRWRLACPPPARRVGRGDEEHHHHQHRRSEITLPSRKCSRKANSATELSWLTTSGQLGEATPAGPCGWRYRRNTVIHNGVKPAGTNSAPQTNSRMVRHRTDTGDEQADEGRPGRPPAPVQRNRPPINRCGLVGVQVEGLVDDVGQVGPGVLHA